MTNLTDASSIAAATAARLRKLDGSPDSSLGNMDDSHMQWKSYLIVLVGVVVVLAIVRSARQNGLLGTLKTRARIESRRRAPLDR